MTPPYEYKCSGIYRFVNKVNGKIYVGQAQNIHARYKEHIRSKLNYPLYLAFRKYGKDSFDFEVIEVVEDLTSLNTREQYWLDFHQSANRSKGYNQRPIAESNRGIKKTPEQVAAMKARLKGMFAGPLNPQWGKPLSPETKAKLYLANKGKKATLETRAKQSAAHQNRTPLSSEAQARVSKIISETFSKRIAQIDIATGKTVQVWANVKAACDALGISKYGIGDCCRGYFWCYKSKRHYKKESYKGFVWQYTDQECTPLVSPEATNVTIREVSKRVAQINLTTWETVKIWESAKEAAKVMGVGCASIQIACRGGYWHTASKKYYPKDSHGGYKWQYVDPNPTTGV